VLKLAIQSATERIDAALRARYVLPLTHTPTLLRNHALYLARFWLYSRRPETKMPDNVKETYHQALKELEQIASGKLHLGIQAIEEPTNDLLPDNSEYEVRSVNRLDTTGY